jgi:predicted Zn-ribbon and HTH transcriptional regulator
MHVTGGNRARNASKRVAVDRHLRQRSHWERLFICHNSFKYWLKMADTLSKEAWFCHSTGINKHVHNPSKKRRLTTYTNSFKNLTILMELHKTNAGPSGRTVKGVSLRPLACWNCGFESHRWHGSVVSVVWCQVEVSETGWSLVQRNSTNFDASLCVI